jgi:Transposase DDE domain group 1
MVQPPEAATGCEVTRLGCRVLPTGSDHGSKNRKQSDETLIVARPHGPLCEEDKSVIRWTRLSCRSMGANAVRLQLHALAYNLANVFRTLVLPDDVEHWSLTTLREKVVKIGAKVIAHARYTVFQMAEVAVPRHLFRRILNLIDELRPRSVARC